MGFGENVSEQIGYQDGAGTLEFGAAVIGMKGNIGFELTLLLAICRGCDIGTNEGTICEKEGWITPCGLKVIGATCGKVGGGKIMDIDGVRKGK